MKNAPAWHPTRVFLIGMVAAGLVGGWMATRHSHFESLRSLRPHESSLEFVAGPAGKRCFATAGDGGTVALWKFDRDDPIWRTKLDAPVEEIVFSKDGSHLAAARRGGEVELIDAATGGGTRLPGMRDILVMGFDEAGERLAIWKQDGSLHLWEADSGALLADLGCVVSWDGTPREPFAPGEAVNQQSPDGWLDSRRGLIFSEDGNFIVSPYLRPAAWSVDPRLALEDVDLVQGGFGSRTEWLPYAEFRSVHFEGGVVMLTWRTESGKTQSLHQKLRVGRHVWEPRGGTATAVADLAGETYAHWEPRGHLSLLRRSTAAFGVHSSWWLTLAASAGALGFVASAVRNWRVRPPLTLPASFDPPVRPPGRSLSLKILIALLVAVGCLALGEMIRAWIAGAATINAFILAPVFACEIYRGGRASRALLLLICWAMALLIAGMFGAGMTGAGGVAVALPPGWAETPAHARIVWALIFAAFGAPAAFAYWALTRRVNRLRFVRYRRPASGGTALRSTPGYVAGS